MSENSPHAPSTEAGTAASTAVPAETIAVITGGARGIGRHLAEAFARAGYHVVITATSAERAETAAVEIAAAAAEPAGGTGAETPGVVTGRGLIADDAASVRALADSVAALEAETGRRLQVLVNNAGRIESTEGPIWDAEPESLAAVVSANVTGVALMINAFAPMLITAAEATGRPSRIIDLNSGSGATGSPMYGVYSASKAALFRLADSVVHYGHEQGLRIFEMAPGVVETAMTKSMPVHDHRGAEDWTTPGEVAALAVALASGSLDAFTGRYLRAGADTEDSLLAEATGLTAASRRLVLG